MMKSNTLPKIKLCKKPKIIVEKIILDKIISFYCIYQIITALYLK